MGDDDDRVLLEEGADAHRLNALLPGLVVLDVKAHEDVHLTRSEQLQAVDLRAAHLDGDIEAVLFVSTLGDRLIQPAVLGLGEPVALEGDFLLCAGDYWQGGGEGSDKRRCRF